jgi:D-alanyl-lipoteichoic acid acyltransferase DltB (MBOAT superfamily)
MFGRQIRSNAAQRVWLLAGLGFNIGLLGFFKYEILFVTLLGLNGRIWSPMLPLGISFFTFQQIMFLVDSARGEIGPLPFLEYACFVAFFPHLVSGPIVRPIHIIPQFSHFAPSLNWRKNLSDGIEIFLLGLAKKVVLADGFSRFANPGFAAAGNGYPISFIEAWVALLAYALQIYFDFSGYCDMAIGLARMFDINFPLNFNSPYQATNISEFWRRWNMTLSGFLRDYFYIPLGGNRHGEIRRIINLMATMLVAGLWHGAAYRFVLWGGLHGIYLVIHGWFRRTGLQMHNALAWPITTIAVILAWVPFRAQNFETCIMLFRGLIGLNGVALPSVLIILFPALRPFVHVVPALPYLGDARTLSFPQSLVFLVLGWFIVLILPNLNNMGRKRRGFALASSFALTAQALFFAPYATPFLYFQF